MIIPMTVDQKIRNLICQQLDLPLERIVNKARFIEDLGVDSLAIVELALAFEEEFSIKIPDEEVDRIKTIEDAFEAVRTRVN